MLLARRRHRVLLVDRATFPSDTLSTHYVQQPAVARLRDWGLLDRLVATGDAYRRIGHFAGRHEPFDAKAREIYLAALFRARQQESFDGVLVAGEAFAALGDREMVQQVVRMAQALAGRDAERQAGVRVFAARVADRAALHGVPRPE